MKFIIVLLLIFNSFKIYGQSKTVIRDSAGVFLTREDFLNNRISYGTNEISLINWIFGIRVIIDIYSNYSVYGKIRFDMADNVRKIFSRGEIFGFYVNGQKYVFIKDYNEYLTVVKEKPIWFYLEAGTAPRFSINPVKKLYYARILEEEPKRFNKRHFLKEFDADSDTTKVLLNILDKLPYNFESGQEEEYKNYVRILNTY